MRYHITKVRPFLGANTIELFLMFLKNSAIYYTRRLNNRSPSVLCHFEDIITSFTQTIKINNILLSKV